MPQIWRPDAATRWYAIQCVAMVTGMRNASVDALLAKHVAADGVEVMSVVREESLRLAVERAKLTLKDGDGDEAGPTITGYVGMTALSCGMAMSYFM